MCEILIRVVSKTNDDPYLDAKCLKRGDVVVIQKDGWAWGREELKNPHWRILSIPAVTPDQAAVFLGPEFETDPANPSATLQSRAFGFDMDKLPALGDDERRVPVIRLNINLEQLLAMKVRKAAVSDPNVLS